ncbi:MAG: translation initiation factor IF-2 [Patescibacteria group bacterium]
MNVTELARILKVPTSELLEKLPTLGFDIGRKAIKVNDKLAQQIMVAWRNFEKQQIEKEKYLKGKETADKKDGNEKGEVKIPPVLTVREFAMLLNMPVTELIAELMKSGVMASVNQRIDYDTAAIIAEDLGFQPVEMEHSELEEKQVVDKAQRVKDVIEKETDLAPRPPVIVVLGHVDHGKTKLLDAIRRTNVMEGEAGGITQHIGAYQVVKKGRKITFIDTPGHEAFTAMRSRGAKVADIAILIIAANDGIKPQTVEALKIAQDAGLPIVVAINKIDLPEANVEKVKQELTQYNLLPEEWGGKTIVAPISAKQNIGIDELLDQLLLVADLEQERIVANPNGQFIGAIVESHIDENLGPVATVLVKNGSLKKGDALTDEGVYYGKIRAMKDYKGDEISQADPSVPVQIIGFKVAPKVGDVIEVTEDVKKAKRKADYYKLSKQEQFISVQQPEQESDRAGVTKLSIILRTDVLGSQEAIIESLEKLENQDIKIDIVAKGLGNITESDVQTAEASNALLLGFNVLPSSAAQILAQDKGIKIKTFKIIYELIDEVKSKLNELIKPIIIRDDLGKIEVLALFRKTDKGQIIGGKVISGKVEANAQAAVFRKDEFVGLGKISELQSGKQEVTDVQKGQEAGMHFIGQVEIQVGDTLDIYREREQKRVI